MNSYMVEANYTTCVQGKATLPEGKTWDDVAAWYVKWDTLYVKFKGGEDYLEFVLRSADPVSGIDWKRPVAVTIYPQDEDGETDYSIEVAGS